MSLIDHVKKHLVPGLISQLMITALAGANSLFHSYTISLTCLLAKFPPPVKYGPPIRPSDMPVPIYGVPVSPIPFPGQIDTGTMFTADHIMPWLTMAASLALYAWIILGWAFYGGILYLKVREEKIVSTYKYSKAFLSKK